MTKKAPVRSSQAPWETPKFQYLRDIESGAKAHAMASQARHEFVAQQELCASRNVVQDAGATQLRADGESESVSRKEACDLRNVVQDAGARVGREKRWFSLEVAKEIPRNSA